MTRLQDRLLRKIREWGHLRESRAVLGTPPAIPADDGVILYSMIGTRVLWPYLVAAKSLHHHLRRGRFVILDDGTLTADDRQVLAHHLGDPEIHHISQVDVGPCPRGGTWERLLLLLDLRRDAYVIQLDSDTVTLGPVPEIAEAIGRGCSFTLRGDADAELLPLAGIAARTAPHLHRDRPDAHVQGAIESVMDQVQITGAGDLRYIRGCSGFAGFALASSGRDLAARFSVEASGLLGKERWAQWGSEQVTSNFVVANEHDPLALPYARYVNFWNDGLPATTAFAHFIGTYRFHGGAYGRATKQAIEALRVGQGPD